MNKIGILALVLVLAASSVLGALHTELSNYDVTVPIGGSVDVVATVDNDGVPQEGIVLTVKQVCKETTAPEYACNAGDEYDPSEVTVTVSGPTDVNGQTIVTLTHDGSDNFGSYHYTVGDATAAADVTGDFFIPEFGVVASVAVLGLAGLYIARKRK